MSDKRQKRVATVRAETLPGAIRGVIEFMGQPMWANTEAVIIWPVKDSWLVAVRVLEDAVH